MIKVQGRLFRFTSIVNLEIGLRICVAETEGRFNCTLKALPLAP